MRPGQAAPVFCERSDRRNGHAAASMRPGQAAPVFENMHHRPSPVNVASMRPGQAAPVFSVVFRNLRKRVDMLQ